MRLLCVVAAMVCENRAESKGRIRPGPEGAGILDGVRPALAQAGHGQGEVPVAAVVDVDGFKARGFEQQGLSADAGAGCGEALPGEEVEVRILLEPGLQVLGAHEVFRIVVHGAAVGAVEAGLDPVDGKKRIGRAGGGRPAEGIKGGADGLGAQQRIGDVGHEVGPGRDMGHIVGQDRVHADGIAADVGPAVAQAQSGAFGQPVPGQDVPGVGVDAHEVDLRHGEQGVEHPAEKRLAAKVAKILAPDSLAVGLHGKQCDKALFFRRPHGSVIPSAEPTRRL